MTMSPSARQLFRIAGVILWLTAGVPALLVLFYVHVPPGPRALAVWFGSFVVFGIAFFWATEYLDSDRRDHTTTVLLVIQTACALAMFQIMCTGFETALLIPIAALLGLFAPLRVAIPWIVAQTAIMGWVGTFHWTVPMAVWWTSGTLGVEVFGLLVASFAASEARARRELARANAELRATRALLSQSSRAAERVRISRDLHDLMGHHLTGLNLHLEVASHVAGERADESISRARAVATELLGDVRRVVSALREEPIAELRPALHALVEDIEVPAIDIACPRGLEVPDPELAHTLVRCVQEAVTNALRHARAEHLWITVCAEDDGISVCVRDDGHGAQPLVIGNGLRGMRERIEAAGGRMDVTAARGCQAARGFQIDLWVPVSERGTP